MTESSSHYDIGDLRSCTFRELRTIARRYYVDVTQLQSKREYIETLFDYLTQRTGSFVWNPQGANFLKLPGELRNQIYELVLVQDTWEPGVDIYFSNLDHGLSEWKWIKPGSNMGPQGPRSALEVFGQLRGLNRLIRHEMTTFFYKNNRFVVATEGTTVQTKRSFPEFNQFFKMLGTTGVVSMRNFGIYMTNDRERVTTKGLRASALFTTKLQQFFNLSVLDLHVPLFTLFWEAGGYDTVYDYILGMGEFPAPVVRNAAALFREFCHLKELCIILMLDPFWDRREWMRRIRRLSRRLKGYLDRVLNEAVKGGIVRLDVCVQDDRGNFHE